MSPKWRFLYRVLSNLLLGDLHVRRAAFARFRHSYSVFMSSTTMDFGDKRCGQTATL